MIQRQLNIVGEIDAAQISGDVPADAQYAMLSKNEYFIQKFYRINEQGMLQYYGEQGSWHYSEYNVLDAHKLPAVHFLLIKQ